LPLAQLYRRAHNAKTPLERHLAAFYLWEAGLKLLGSVAVVEYARRPDPDPQLAERLQNLARPSLGHWWEFVRRLVPVLADQGDESFRQVADLVLGRTRDDCPRAAGLDAVLREALDGQSGSRATVRFTELFDRLVRYRNQEIGHGAAGQRPSAFYERMDVSEVLSRLDVLAGRRLLYIAEVRQVQGVWLVQRYELASGNACRIPSLELPHTEAARLPFAERVYLEREPALCPLHPLLLYDAEADEVLFLNARRGKRRTEYLSYSTGRTTDRPTWAASSGNCWPACSAWSWTRARSSNGPLGRMPRNRRAGGVSPLILSPLIPNARWASSSCSASWAGAAWVWSTAPGSRRRAGRWR
jgi:hypothetical protein